MVEPKQKFYVKSLGTIEGKDYLGIEFLIDKTHTYSYDVRIEDRPQIFFKFQSQFKFSTPYTKNNMTKVQDAETVIEENYITKDSIYNGPYTKTTLFLLPMLDLNLRNAAIKKFLVNAYIDDADYEHDYTRPIFLLLKTKNFEDKDFINLCAFLRTMFTYKMDYDLGTQNGESLVMLVFETPEKWKHDYYHFKSGRYSKFSDEYKSKFPKEVVGADKRKIESLVFGVIHKTPYRKDQVASHFCVKDDITGKIKDQVDYEKIRKEMDSWEEVWDAPSRETEVYRYKS